MHAPEVRSARRARTNNARVAERPEQKHEPNRTEPRKHTYIIGLTVFSGGQVLAQEQAGLGCAQQPQGAGLGAGGGVGLPQPQGFSGSGFFWQGHAGFSVGSLSTMVAFFQHGHVSWPSQGQASEARAAVAHRAPMASMRVKRMVGLRRVCVCVFVYARW